jgi:hypothetical protein
VIGQSGVLADTDYVEVGMTVLALDLEGDTDADLQDVRGGVVVAIDTHVDPDSGEINRSFICAKQWRRQIRWSTLTAADVRDVLPFDAAAVRRLIKALARDIADTKGVLLTNERKAIDAIHVLAQVA